MLGNNENCGEHKIEPANEDEVLNSDEFVQLQLEVTIV